MAIANINWTIGQLSGKTPLTNCPITILVARDGVNVGSFTVTTTAAGAATYAYADPNASATATHVYVFTAQLSGCSAGAVIAPVTVNWNCAGTAPPPPPPAPPPPPPAPAPSVGCPETQDSFEACGQTAPQVTTAVGASLTLTQSFGSATSVVITSAVPGTTPTTTATGGTLSGTPSTPGLYNVVFTASKAGCALCSVTRPVLVQTANVATQSIRVVKGSSTYSVPSSTSFNAGDQLLELTLAGVPGQTYHLVGTGTVNTDSGVLTLPSPSGVATISVPVGLSAGYSTTWEFLPAGPNPVTISNPGGVNITGNTCVTLSITQTATDYTIIVTAPPGATNVPFGLSFGGPQFGASSASCAANSFGVTNNGFSTGSSNIGVIGPFAVTAPYSAAVKLNLLDSAHGICGPACAEVVFP